MSGLFSRFSAVVSVLALALSCNTAHALDYDGVLAAGYDWGADDLVNLKFTTGKTAVMHVNEGATLSLGILFYNTNDLLWQTQVTAGAKYREIDAQNGGASWLSYPVEVIQFFNTELIRIGLGLSYQIHPQIETSGVVAGYSVDFDNTLGYVAQIGFKARKKGGLSVDIRYSTIKFSGEIQTNGQTLALTGANGSSLGLQLGIMF